MIVEPIGEMIQGEFLSNRSSEVNEAITNVCYALEKAEGVTAIILQEHLKRLCDIQCLQLNAVNMIVQERPRCKN